ncbi:MAG: 30S ribosomal protein S11 [Candidatus Pacebacteria bacterium]|nr:30S ribosomal protein S11 [Candidatus Paceibacterota bacterium]
MGKKKVIQKSGGEGAEQKVESTSSRTSSSKKVDTGFAYVNATYNNTMISVTDASGNLVAWSSAGSLGFTGPKKATPFAAAKVVSTVIEKIKKSGPFNIHVIVKGVGSGRDSAVRTFAAQGFNILSVKDATPIPHNGPKPPKVRRV